MALVAIAAIALARVGRLAGVRITGQVVSRAARDVGALAKELVGAFPPDGAVAEKDRPATVAECFAFARGRFGVGPVQRVSEISRLLELARENGAATVCEIGAYHAGTSSLFSLVLRPDTLIAMDLYVRYRWRLRRYAPSVQTIGVIDGDSSHPLTRRRLERKLRGRELDLLLIDGDHRWAGVRQDFLTYRHLVRDGGLIAFHDICEVTDAGGPAWAGDVPAFWRLLRPLYPGHEFIETPGQQGFGIGVLRYDSSVPVEPVLAATERC